MSINNKHDKMFVLARDSRSKPYLRFKIRKEKIGLCLWGNLNKECCFTEEDIRKYDIGKYLESQQIKDVSLMEICEEDYGENLKEPRMNLLSNNFETICAFMTQIKTGQEPSIIKRVQAEQKDKTDDNAVKTNDETEKANILKDSSESATVDTIALLAMMDDFNQNAGGYTTNLQEKQTNVYRSVTDIFHYYALAKVPVPDEIMIELTQLLQELLKSRTNTEKELNRIELIRKRMMNPLYHQGEETAEVFYEPLVFKGLFAEGKPVPSPKEALKLGKEWDHVLHS